MLRIAEAQRIHRRDRPRAHGEHVAQDAAHARRRALVGLDEAGVVVRLHLEDDRLPVADIDDAGILARALDHPRAGGRQRAQPLLARLVRAVLVPHRREDAELGVGRRAPDQLDDLLVLVELEPVVGNELGRDGDVVVEGHGIRACRGRLDAVLLAQRSAGGNSPRDRVFQERSSAQALSVGRSV